MKTEREPLGMYEKIGVVKEVYFKKEWKGLNCKMFDFSVEFENGDRGVYQCREKEQTKFIKGKQVGYTIEIIEKESKRFTDIFIRPNSMIIIK